MKASTMCVVILLALLGWLQYKLWLSPEGIPQFWVLKGEIAQLMEANDITRERNARVVAEIDDLKEGSDAVEEHARKDLGLVKPDEVFYQIVQ